MSKFNVKFRMGDSMVNSSHVRKVNAETPSQAILKVRNQMKSDKKFFIPVTDDDMFGFDVQRVRRRL